MLLTFLFEVPTTGLAAGIEDHNAVSGVQVPAPGYGEVRRVWVLTTTDDRSTSEAESAAQPERGSAIQYELKCEAGHLQSAQRSFSVTGYGEGRTWTVTVNGGLLSRGGASVLNSALETVCGV